MLHVGDIVRVRRYDDIPEHPIYRCRFSRIAESYFGISKVTIDRLSGKGEMIVTEVIRDNQWWFEAESEKCRELLTQRREPVYKISHGRNNVFLENMLEPVDPFDPFSNTEDTAMPAGDEDLLAFLFSAESESNL